jgi:hypothetical protein
MRIVQLNSHAISSTLDVTDVLSYIRRLWRQWLSVVHKREAGDMVLTPWRVVLAITVSTVAAAPPGGIFSVLKNREMLIIASLVCLDFYKLQDFSYNRKIHPSVFMARMPLRL